MAEAKLGTRKVEKWVEVDEETVVLTLSVDEARTLRGVCALIGGRGEDRSNMDAIAYALNLNGIKGHRFDFTVPEDPLNPRENTIYIYGRLPR